MKIKEWRSLENKPCT